MKRDIETLEAAGDLLRSLGHDVTLRFRPADETITRDQFAVMFNGGCRTADIGWGNTPADAYRNLLAQTSKAAA